VTAGDIDWPAPQRMNEPPLTVYGYENEILLPAPLTIDKSYAGGPLDVSLHASWLICEKSCVPEEGDFTLTVPGAGASDAKAAFDAALAQRPSVLPGVSGTAAYQGAKLVVRVTGLPASAKSAEIGFIPETQFVIDHAKPVAAKWDGDVWIATMPAATSQADFGSVLNAVLTFSNGPPARVALGANGAPSPTLAPQTAATQSAPQTGPAPIDWPGFAVKLVLAFVGGVLLNLMPCVFPVLSLKALSIARHADERRALAASGFSYAAGVVLTFLALAGALLAARGLGQQLGWGFQLQSAPFVAAMAVLFFLIGLNLIGVFEFGSVLPSSVAALRAKNPVADSFLTGVLAVAVASPCTAPFMAGSIGLALTLPAIAALSLFLALGLGLAAPLLLVSLAPQLAKVLPKPGAWMERFKQVMAFPMFAAVVWLVWVLSVGIGPNGVLAALGLLLAFGFAAWMWRISGNVMRVAAAVVVVLSIFLARPLLDAGPSAEAQAAQADAWGQNWSFEKVAEATKAGKPALVDFTAAWCVTCQVNKAVLHDREVVAALDRCGVQRFVADWTRQDPAISAALAGLGRSGVPVYALYRSGEDKPTLLSELLIKGDVLRAVSDLPSCSAQGEVKGAAG
jgi:thiol:disulfide interchange protein DsbD